MIDGACVLLHAPRSPESLTEKISIRNVSFYYEVGNHALIDVSAPIYEHKVTAFFGPSGCGGKSTLLRIFNRIYDLYSRQRVMEKSCSMVRTSS